MSDVWREKVGQEGKGAKAEHDVDPCEVEGGSYVWPLTSLVRGGPNHKYIVVASLAMRPSTYGARETSTSRRYTNEQWTEHDD